MNNKIGHAQFYMVWSRLRPVQLHHFHEIDCLFSAYDEGCITHIIRVPYVFISKRNRTLSIGRLGLLLIIQKQIFSGDCEKIKWRGRVVTKSIELWLKAEKIDWNQDGNFDIIRFRFRWIHILICLMFTFE